MKNRLGQIRMWGITLSRLLVAAVAFALAQFARAEVIDMGGATDSTTNLGDYKYNGVAIKNNELINGVLNVTGNQQFGDATFTFGSDLTLNQTANQWGIAGGRTVKFINGAVLNYTSTSDIYFGRLTDGKSYNGTTQLILDNATVDAAAALCFSSRASNSGYDKNVVLNFTMINNSVLTLPTTKELKFGEIARADNRSQKTIKVTAAITNSTITAKQIRVGQTNSYITDNGNSYNNITFGPGTVLNLGQVYSYAYPTPTVVFDGAKICWLADTGDSIVGQNDGVTKGVYTIGPNGLVIDKQDGFDRTSVSSYAAALSGTGGITKTGPGDITWNNGNIGGSRSSPMTFTGPLVVSNGTWTSKLGYAATAFRADGGKLVLSGPLSAANVELAATEGGTLTLAGATITDVSPDVMLAGGGSTDYFTRDGVVDTYTLDSLTLWPGAVLDLDANATAIDAIDAIMTNILATAEDKATINLNFSAAPAGGQTFTLFETDSADKFNVVLKLGSLTPLHSVSVVDGYLVVTIVAESYTWKGTQTNWGDADAWTTGGADATWADGNNAVFATANAEVALAAPAIANKVEISGNTTISGEGTLTAADVSVADGVAATIAAPTSGAMMKTGAGTLVLTQNRTYQTTLAEGTLVMESATVDAAKLALGVDAAKPVTFDYCGQQLSGDWPAYLTPGADITLTNGTFTTTHDPAWLHSTMPKSLTIAKGAVMTTSERFTWNASNIAGEDVTNTVNIAGGSLVSTKVNNNWIVQNSRSGTLVFNVTDGGLLEFAYKTYMLPCRDSTTTADTPSLLMTFNDSTFRVKDANLLLGHDDEQKKKDPKEPILELAMTNSVLDIGTGRLYVGYNSVQSNHGGHYICDFKDSVITAQTFAVYHDRPANAVRLDGVTFVMTANNDWSIEASSYFDSLGGEWAGRTPITIGAGGLTVDTQDFNGQVKADLFGNGTVTKKGSGRLTIAHAQTTTGALVCEQGEMCLNAGLSAMNRPVTVKDGATFTVKATAQSTVAGLTLEAGSTLNIDSYTLGTTPLVVEALTLPAEGKVALKLNGAPFLAGRYAILHKTGSSLGDFANLEVSVDGLDATCSVEDGTLYVTVKGENDYIWTGNGDGEKFSDGGNWLGDTVPPDGANLHVGVVADSTLDFDMANFVPQSITFLVGSAAVTINGDEAISGVVAITNLSAKSHTINVPVQFAGDIQVKQEAMAEVDDLTKAHVTFAGGAYAAAGYALDNGNFSAIYSRCIFGRYYLANAVDNRWTATVQSNGKRICLAENASLFIPYAGALSEIYVSTGAKVEVGDMLHVSGRLSWRNYGQIVITNLTATGTGDRFVSYNQGTSVSSVFKFGSMTTAMTDNWFYLGDGSAASKHELYIGEGGLNFESVSARGSYAIGRNAQDNSVTIRPWYSDFTIGGRGNGDVCLVLIRGVTFLTDDESGTGRTITMDAIAGARDTPTITVSGSGRLKVNSAAANVTQPPVTVKDTATLAFKPGASLTSDSITVNSGATLAVAESGTFSLGGNLKLKAGAKLEFNFTERTTAPVLDASGNTVTFDTGATTNVVVKLSAAEGSRPSCRNNGIYTLTASGGAFAGVGVALDETSAPEWVNYISVVDGEIVIAVKVSGHAILIR